MKTILVPVGGGDSDGAAFAGAFAVARAVGAHLEFLHIGLDAADAALHTPHMEFARGNALSHALDELGRRAKNRQAAAERNVREFCSRFDIALVEQPCSSTAMVARWRQEHGDALARLLFHARHNDLTIMTRAAEADGLPPDRLETLLLDSGRPLLIVPNTMHDNRLGTVMLCWKETAEAARAAAAAMPLLKQAQNVVVIGVREGDGQLAFAVSDLVRQLAWHGIAAEPHIIASDGRPAAEALQSAARDYRADLMVMGGYGRWRMSEVLFGGCTQTVLEDWRLPVLLAH